MRHATNGTSGLVVVWRSRFFSLDSSKVGVDPTSVVCLADSEPEI